MQTVVTSLDILDENKQHEFGSLRTAKETMSWKCMCNKITDKCYDFTYHLKLQKQIFDPFILCFKKKYFKQNTS